MPRDLNPSTIRGRAARVLREHRVRYRDPVECACGWCPSPSEGWDAHQARMLAEAGLLRGTVAVVPDCPSHRLVQHRDSLPPWCRDCGRDALGDLIGRPRKGRT